MRNVLATTALVMLTVGADASDLPKRSAAPAPAPPAGGSSSWSGFYAGAVGGFAQTDSRIQDNYLGTGDSLGEFDGDWFGHKPSGFLGGLAAGYNWQSGRLVYGLEGDIAASSLSKTSFEGSSSDGLITRLGVVSTLRGRLGYSISDPLLIYGTAGVAGGYFSSVGGDRGSSPGWEESRSVLSLGRWKLGWTAGGGAEMKLGNNWSARLEYLYADFGRNKGTINDDGENARFKDTAHIARVGLVYRFGSSAR
jgi:outer membrane immunogenic protein